MTTRSFKVGELQREIDRRGLSQATLAFVAGVHPSTIFKACQGNPITPASFTKINRALARRAILKSRALA